MAGNSTLAMASGATLGLQASSSFAVSPDAEAVLTALPAALAQRGPGGVGAGLLQLAQGSASLSLMARARLSLLAVRVEAQVKIWLSFQKKIPSLSLSFPHLFFNLAISRIVSYMTPTKYS
jgi:hypothetical protein